MTSRVRDISFMNPADQAAYAVEQQRAAERQRLANVLQQQAAGDIDVPAGSRISWTQGLAKMLSGYAAGKLRRENYASQWDLAAMQGNNLAAAHDPTGTAIPRMSLDDNPYRKHGRAKGHPAPDQAPELPATAPADQSGGGFALTPTERTWAENKLSGDERGPAGGVPAPVPASPPVQANQAPTPAPAAQPSPEPPAAALAPSGPQLAAGLQRYGAVNGLTRDVQDQQVSAKLANEPQPPVDQMPVGQPPMPAPAAAAPPTGMPTAPAALPPVMDAMVPTMTARDAYRMHALYPEQYGKVIEAANTPTDAAKTALGMGLTPGTQGWADYMKRVGEKAAYVAPFTAKGGDYVVPQNGGVPYIAPDTERGRQFQIGQDGRITATPIDGVVEDEVRKTREVDGAKNGIRYVTGPDGQPRAVPVAGYRGIVADNAGAVTQAQEDNKIIPGQTVNGRTDVPVTGAQVRNGGATFGSTPGRAEYAKGSAEQAVAYRTDLNARVHQGHELTQRLDQQEQLLKQFTIGATGPARARMAAIARDMGVGEGVVTAIGNGDPAAAQAFQKFAAQTALEGLKQSIGANRMLQTEVVAFQKANPNIATDPKAFAKVAAFQRRLYERDFQQQQELSAWEQSGRNPADFPAAYERRVHDQGHAPRGAGAPRQVPAQAAPRGMRRIGTYQGRPIYQDAYGRRMAG